MGAMPWSPREWRGGDMFREMIKVHSKLDLILLQQQELKADQADHENRIRHLESGKAHQDLEKRLIEAINGLETRMRDTERWRWQFPSVAVIFGAASLALTLLQLFN